jgi:energy-coupling factor transport system ATP-binding protein
MGVQLRNVSFSYPGKPVLKDITWAARDGDFVGISGSTGSGKTTMIYCLNGLIPHSIRGEFSGEVIINGRSTADCSIAEIARKVGLVFQDPDWQLFSLSVREEIAFGLKNLKMGSIEGRVRKALKMVGLEEYEDAEPHKLSQGQKQKLCIASVLAMEPDILILDEPSSQLDYRSVMNIYGILRHLHGEGKTIIVIEHNTDLIAEYANRTILLDGGRIAAQGKTGDVLSDRKTIERLGIKYPWCYRK